MLSEGHVRTLRSKSQQLQPIAKTQRVACLCTSCGLMKTLHFSRVTEEEKGEEEGGSRKMKRREEGEEKRKGMRKSVR